MWLRDNYKTGIRFYSNGNTEPCIFYDAGHNQYSSDCKAHHESLKAYLAPTGLVSEPRGDLTCRGDLRIARRCNRSR